MIYEIDEKDRLAAFLGPGSTGLAGKRQVSALLDITSFPCTISSASRDFALFGRYLILLNCAYTAFANSTVR